MATSITKYNNYILKQNTGVAINWSSDTIKIMLVSSSYIPDVDNHIFKSSISDEVVGAGYNSGGATIDSLSAIQSGGILTIRGNSVIWTQHSAGFTNARYGVIYKDTGINTTSLLVGYIDFGADKNNVNGDLILNFNSTPVNGIIFTSS